MKYNDPFKLSHYMFTSVVCQAKEVEKTFSLHSVSFGIYNSDMNF